jgi:ferric-dicitrate binding protein FerR (iron transport regulator)
VIPKHTDERVLLQPGEKGVFRKETRKLEKLENKDVNFIAWKTKKIIFKGDSFRYIAEQIEKVYNVKVIIRSEALEKCRITTSFNQLPLPAVLNVLTSMLDIRVQQEENTIIITGKGC